MLELDFSDFKLREFSFEKKGVKKVGYEFFKQEVHGYQVITYRIVFFTPPEIFKCNVIIQRVRFSDKANNFVWVEFSPISSTKQQTKG